MSALTGKIGRWIRVQASQRVLADLRRERTQYRSEWQSDEPYSMNWERYYAGYRDGLQQAINLIETEYR